MFYTVKHPISGFLQVEFCDGEYICVHFASLKKVSVFMLNICVIYKQCVIGTLLYPASVNSLNFSSTPVALELLVDLNLS